MAALFLQSFLIELEVAVERDEIISNHLSKTAVLSLSKYDYRISALRQAQGYGIDFT